MEGPLIEPDAAALPALTSLEIASGIVCGPAGDDFPHAAEPPDRVTTPLAALEAAVLPALHRSPCLVSFSGGFDSSVVLAAALKVARREGLPEPVPISWRFRAAPRADESEWQERVVAELAVDDWIKLEAGPELELAGDVALRALAPHGVLYPANAFLMAPLLERARGGSLLTGVGGDEILGRWPGGALADARARRRRPVARDAARAALASAPQSLRARRIMRHDPCAPLPWLRAPFARRVRAEEAFERAGEPGRFDRRVDWQAGRRRLRLGLHSLELLAADAGAVVACPLLAPRFLAALGRAAGRDGFGDRRATLEATVAAVVPRSLGSRRSKATFAQVFFAADTRTFVAGWTGLGIDPEIVDLGALRRLWREPNPSLLTALLMQQAALAARARDSTGPQRSIGLA